MFKKITALFFLFAFLNVSAFAQTTKLKSLSKVYDNFQYSLSVDWDQKDQNFKTKVMDRFQAEVKRLQKEGLTNQQLIEFVLGKTKHKEVKEGLKGLFDVVEADKMSPTQAREFLLENLSKNYSDGLSWLGSRGNFVFIAALVIIVVLSAASKATYYGSSNYGYGSYGSNCYDDYICNDYCDSWGYCYSDCYWTTYCY